MTQISSGQEYYRLSKHKKAFAQDVNLRLLDIEISPHFKLWDTAWDNRLYTH
jgi:hypothetical protein